MDEIITWKVLVSLVIILTEFIFLKRITKAQNLMGTESVEASFLSFSL